MIILICNCLLEIVTLSSMCFGQIRHVKYKSGSVRFDCSMQAALRYSLIRWRSIVHKNFMLIVLSFYKLR